MEECCRKWRGINCKEGKKKTLIKIEEKRRQIRVASWRINVFHLCNFTGPYFSVIFCKICDFFGSQFSVGLISPANSGVDLNSFKKYRWIFISCKTSSFRNIFLWSILHRHNLNHSKLVWSNIAIIILYHSPNF